MADAATVVEREAEATQPGQGLAHIATHAGSYVGLCGFRGTRHGAPGDPEGRQWCVVCKELHDGR